MTHLTYTDCPKSITAEIPGTQIPIELVCCLMNGHEGDHKGNGTFNGHAFSVTWETHTPIEKE